MPRTRQLVSGRDFQLRYALLRLVQLALRIDPMHDRVARVRLEWPVLAPTSTIDVDLVLENAKGRIVEITECKEHLGHLPLASVRSFLDAVKQLRKRGRSFRFVSTARYLDDGRDMANAAVRKTVLGITGPDIRWELGVPGKDSLTDKCIALLQGASNPTELYARLYSRLAAQMAGRLPGERDALAPLIRDPHNYLFANPTRPKFDRNSEESFAVAELRDELARTRSPRARAFPASRRALEQAQAGGIFGESEVTLDQIFVEPAAISIVHNTDGSISHHPPASALELLHNAIISKSKVPLLVLAPFGLGKTSLLQTFGRRVLDSGSHFLPLYVPMRELKTAGSQISLLHALERYIHSIYDIDLPAYGGEIVLLCDGFDELNLFYAHDENQRWVESGYRQLASLAQRFNISVVISGRPILFLGTTAARDDGATIFELQPFTDEQIDEWCKRYRISARLKTDLSLCFLDERNLVEVARTPIVLYMIARIVETEPETLEPKRYTKAEIYRLFVDWTERGGYRRDAPKHALPANYREILQDIAWQLFQSGRGMLSDRELIDALRAKYGTRTPGDIPVDRNLLTAHMLTTRRDSPSDRMIEFTHQSFREYLVAERIWHLLEPARRGEGLTAETWIALGGRLLTEAKIELLIEMVNAMPLDEAAALYDALDDTDNIHAYWSKWSRPVWHALEHGTQHISAAKAFFDTLAARTSALAALSMTLKIKLFRRLDRRGDSVDGTRLRVLLSFLETFPDLGVGDAARTLLLTNIGGLRLTRTLDLSQAALHNVRFGDAIVANVYFNQARITGATMTGSEFTNCRFAHAQMHATLAEYVIFENCDFRSAEVELPSESVQFRNCDFSNASLTGPFPNCTFVDCSWTGARVDTDFWHCTLDRKTYDFLRAAGARTRNIVLVARSKHLPDRRPKVPRP
jgi:hypothetical protein